MRPKDEILTRYSDLTGTHLSTQDEALEALYPDADGTELLLAVNPAGFSASTIARAVEDVGHHLINMNVMGRRIDEPERLLVAVRLDSGASIDRLTRSLGRYGYDIVGASSAASGIVDEERRRRVAELLHILEI